MITSTWVLPLTAGSRGVAELGGKADALARLVAAGFAVPPGFCLTTAAYESYVSQPGLDQALTTQRHTPDAIAALFADHPIPAELANAILSAYAELGSPAVAVRSSATAEDSSAASFAGQLESFLNVRGDAALLDAVRRCWASAWTDRALTYRERQGISAAGLGVGVVVQRLVDADAAGIMFTADPMTGATDTVQIDAAWGLGEAVVAGSVTADTFRVDAGTQRVVSKTIADKQVFTGRHPTGITTQPVPTPLRQKPSLTTRQVERLAELGLAIAVLFGQPVDVEWCRSGDELFILQARPITSGDDRSAPDPWNDSRTTYALWTSTNVGEAMPDVLTPAAWSMVQVFLNDAMATSSIPPHLGYGQIGGRVYLNLAVMYGLARLLGVSERRMRAMTQEVLGRVPDELPVPPLRASRLKLLASTIPVAVDVQRRARRDMKRFGSYLDAHPAVCHRLQATIRRVDGPVELAALWRSTVLPGFHEVNWMLSAATRSSGFSFVTMRERLRRLIGDADANAILTGLGGSGDDLASLGLMRGLAELADGAIDRERFNQTYGHRGPHEFEIATPRPAEEPGWIDDQLAQRRAEGLDFNTLLRAQRGARGAAWERLRRDHPSQAARLAPKLARWSRVGRNREWARNEVVRYFWVLRTYAVRAGELSGLGDDVFFLDADRIAAALHGVAVDRDSMAAARQAYGGYRALPGYPPLILGHFDPHRWAADPARRTDLFAPGWELTPGTVVRGFPGSAGRVEGTVRVIQDPADGADLEPGEVLVTTVTNVGWTPIFPRAGAIVTDVGAPLSHAAIVARELGIPAVVGCGNATARLETGDRVRVDGGAGVVELLSSDTDGHGHPTEV